MKLKNLFGAGLIAVCLMTGCANSMAAIYDDDIKIASSTNSYKLNNYKQTVENGHFTASVEKMEGMDTIWVFDAEEDTSLNITYALNVYSGKAKLVLIPPRGDVSIIAECDTEMSEPIQSTLNVESGYNRIKIVAGENTKFDIEISIQEGEFKELG